MGDQLINACPPGAAAVSPSLDAPAPTGLHKVLPAELLGDAEEDDLAVLVNWDLDSIHIGKSYSAQRCLEVLQEQVEALVWRIRCPTGGPGCERCLAGRPELGSRCRPRVHLRTLFFYQSNQVAHSRAHQELSWLAKHTPNLQCFAHFGNGQEKKDGMQTIIQAFAHCPGMWVAAGAGLPSAAARPPQRHSVVVIVSNDREHIHTALSVPQPCFLLHGSNVSEALVRHSCWHTTLDWAQVFKRVNPDRGLAAAPAAAAGVGHASAGPTGAHRASVRLEEAHQAPSAGAGALRNPGAAPPTALAALTDDAEQLDQDMKFLDENMLIMNVAGGTESLPSASSSPALRGAAVTSLGAPATNGSSLRFATEKSSQHGASQAVEADPLQREDPRSTYRSLSLWPSEFDSPGVPSVWGKPQTPSSSADFYRMGRSEEQRLLRQALGQDEWGVDAAAAIAQDSLLDLPLRREAPLPEGDHLELMAAAAYSAPSYYHQQQQQQQQQQQHQPHYHRQPSQYVPAVPTFESARPAAYEIGAEAYFNPALQPAQQQYQSQAAAERYPPHLQQQQQQQHQQQPRLYRDLPGPLRQY